MGQFFEARRDHYREMACGIRYLARQARLPSIRRELVAIANRYDRLADDVDCTIGYRAGEPHPRFESLVDSSGDPVKHDAAVGSHKLTDANPP
jgi:hypothetical protein